MGFTRGKRVIETEASRREVAVDGLARAKSGDVFAARAATGKEAAPEAGTGAPALIAGGGLALGDAAQGQVQCDGIHRLGRHKISGY
jgi:hypothetical protein